MSIVGSNALAGASGQSAGGGGAGYQISRSVRLNSADTANFTRTVSTASNRKTWTYSLWAKLQPATIGGYNLLWSATPNGSSGDQDALYIDSSTDQMIFMMNITDPGGSNFTVFQTQRKFRDPSAWQHIVLRYDATASSNYVKLWINGVEETAFTTDNRNSSTLSNHNAAWNAAGPHRIGVAHSNNDRFNGYLAEIHFVDGTALAASDFGEFDSNNVWQAKAYSGAYGPTPVNYYDNSQTDLPDGNVYLGSQPVENIFDGSDTTYARINRGSNSQTVATFKWEPTGGYAGVTKLRIKYNYSQQYRINGGTWYNVNNNGGYQEIYNGSSFTLNTLEIRRSDASGSDYGIYVHAIEINDSLVTNINNNGFYLNFSDNTSTTTLAEDSSGSNNDWTANNISVTDSDGTIYAEFDGSNNKYLRKSGQGVLPGSNGAFTIECHFYPHSTNVIGLFDGGSGQTSIIRNYGNNTIAKQGGGSVSFAGDYTQNAWNHIAVVYTGSTGTDTLTVYVNGVSSGSASGLNGFTPGSNFDIGTINGGGDGKFDGFLRNFRVTHSAVYTSAFTAPSHANNLTAIANTKLLVITTPGNGLTTDASVSNYTLTNNGSVQSASLAAASQTDSFIDTPTNYTADSGNNGGNYATLNPLDVNSSTTLSNGNLFCDKTGTSGYGLVKSSIAVSSGKWYCEYKLSGADQVVGVTLASNGVGNGDYVSSVAGGIGYYSANGSIYTISGSSAYGNTFGSGDVIGIALDLDNGKVFFSKNGTFQNSGDPAAGTNPAASSLSGTYVFGRNSGAQSNTTADGDWNFGQRPFQYPPGGTGGPSSDYKSICTTNLPAPTISDPSTVMDAVTYTGNGSSKTISGVGFSSDLIWTKCRNQARSHYLMDTVRGISKYLISEQTSAEGTNTTNRILSVTSDGWTLGINNSFNGNNDTYVAWAWDAGSSNTTISAGSLNSTAYNQSAVWSGMCSPTPDTNTFANGFDGSTTTTFAGGINAGEYFTFTPTGGITFTDKIRVYNGAVSGASYKYNNGSATTFPTNSWTTVATGGGTMTSFAVTRSGTAVHGWYAIEVDGKILVDQGATPAVNVPAVASTCRTNQTAGFSIVSYTGNSVAGSKIGHNLNAQPSLILLKNRDRSINWAVGHLAANSFVDGDLNLNTTNAKGTGYVGFFGADPTSSVFTVQGNYESNYANEDYIAYCFSPVEGYSAFPSHTVQSGTNFVYLGFRAKLVILKRTGVGTTTNISYASWAMFDTERDTYNEVDFDTILYGNRNYAEGKRGDGAGSTGGSYLNIDILSNGIRFQSGAAEFSQPSDKIIVMAWAENPFSLNGGLAR